MTQPDTDTDTDIAAEDDDLVLARRRAVVAAMADADLDVLVLGRQDDAGYASGATRLWTAGTRPFGAGCVVVRDGDPLGQVHLISSWSAGVPASVPFDHLLPLTWNPQTMADNLGAIDGLTAARRIGVDTWSPGFARTAERLAPGAELVAADDLMNGVRRRKRPAEIERIRAACHLCRLGVDATLEAHSSGERSADRLAAVAVTSMADAGATIPSSGVEVVVDGDDLLTDIGMLVAGYEGGIGGRYENGVRMDEASELVRACTAGAAWTDLAAAAGGAGWQVRGLGMGFERPVLGPDIGRLEHLDAGMVLSVRCGHHRDVVTIGPDGAAEILSAP